MATADVDGAAGGRKFSKNYKTGKRHRHQVYILFGFFFKLSASFLAVAPCQWLGVVLAAAWRSVCSSNELWQ